MSKKKDLSEVPIIVIEELSLLKKIIYGVSYRVHDFVERNEAEEYIARNKNKKLSVFINSRLETFCFINPREKSEDLKI